jgi:hypothetical protein
VLLVVIVAITVATDGLLVKADAPNVRTTRPRIHPAE